MDVNNMNEMLIDNYIILDMDNIYRDLYIDIEF